MIKETDVFKSEDQKAIAMGYQEAFREKVDLLYLAEKNQLIIHCGGNLKVAKKSRNFFIKNSSYTPITEIHYLPKKKIYVFQLRINLEDAEDHLFLKEIFSGRNESC